MLDHLLDLLEAALAQALQGDALLAQGRREGREAGLAEHALERVDGRPLLLGLRLVERRRLGGRGGEGVRRLLERRLLGGGELGGEARQALVVLRVARRHELVHVLVIRLRVLLELLGGRTPPAQSADHARRRRPACMRRGQLERAGAEARDLVLVEVGLDEVEPVLVRLGLLAPLADAVVLERLERLVEKHEGRVVSCALPLLARELPEVLLLRSRGHALVRARSVAVLVARLGLLVRSRDCAERRKPPAHE